MFPVIERETSSKEILYDMHVAYETRALTLEVK